MVGYFKRYGKEFKRTLLIGFVSIISTLIITFSLYCECDTAYAAANSSACVIEVSSGRILYGENVNLRLPMASTTKAMTALLAVESGRLDEIVTIPKEAEGVEGSSIYLKEGEQLSLRDLTYGLMLRSGNDAAVAIAYHLGGSINGFADIMNKRIADMGLNDTHFVNPHGLHDDSHYTSAYDLAMIAAVGMKNNEFKALVSSKKYTCGQGEDSRCFTNKNKLLWNFEGANGVKTGYTKKAGRCLLAAAERDGMQLVSAVLNVPPMFEKCAMMMETAFSQYKMLRLFKAGEPIGNVSLIYGIPATVGVGPAEDVSIPLKDGETASYEIQLTKDIVNKDNFRHNLGVINIFVDEQLLFCRTLFTLEEVKFLENTT